MVQSGMEYLGNDQWQAVHQVQPCDDLESEVSFSISFSDVTGNPGVEVSSSVMMRLLSIRSGSTSLLQRLRPRVSKFLQTILEQQSPSITKTWLPRNHKTGEFDTRWSSIPSVTDRLENEVQLQPPDAAVDGLNIKSENIKLIFNTR